MSARLLPLLCVPVFLAATCAMGQEAEPGEEWLTTTEMQMSGMSMPAQTFRSCQPKGSTEPPRGPNDDDDCEMYDVERTGTTTKWKMRCTGERTMSGAGEITYQGRDSYAGQMVMTMDGQTMTLKMSGRRTGAECDAGKVKRQVAQAQAQGDRMREQQCAEAVSGMQVMRFDGSHPLSCDEKYKREFCARLSTEEGYDLIAGPATMPATGLTQLQSAGKACGVDPVAVQGKLCAGAQKKESLVFLARYCPDQSAPIAQQECAGRTYTTPPAAKYREFCNTYAQHALRGDGAGAAAGAGAAIPGAGQDGAAPKDGAVEKGRKALKKLLPF